VFDVDGLREEPDAGKPHVRICEGEAEWPSYSTTIFELAGSRNDAGRLLPSLHVE
jgi:hypothetical protein